MKRVSALILLLSIIISFPSPCQKGFSKLSSAEKKLYNEHIVEGQPDGLTPVFVRNGYVLRYNEKYRIPDWVAYHIKPDYLKTPKREKKYATFRTDPDMDNAVVSKDYTGSGYARGHMAPYFAMGGDRNKNGVYANPSKGDPYDDLTVFQANYMSNMCPQDQNALNGAGGPWYALETAIRNKLVKKFKMELNLVVGSIILDPDDYELLNNNDGETDIAVPDEFFQILIYRNKDTGEYITGAFLFPHVNEPEDLPYDALLDYLVTVDEIEKKTGLNFLSKLSEQEQQKTESTTNRDFWKMKIDN